MQRTPIFQRNWSRLSCAIAFALLAAPGMSRSETAEPAGADEADDATTLESVTVVARQRSESVQEVPIAVSVFTAQQIERAGIEKPADFVQMTPNVSIVQAQNSGTSFLSVRGLTQVRNGESPVATVVDGVQQVSPNQFNDGLFEIDSIEVLKGPQGALYGRNAIGGAINVLTRQPEDVFAASAQIGLGNGGRTAGRFSLTGPIGESGKVRYLVAGSYLDFDGLIENTYRNERVDPELSRQFRVRVMADVSDTLHLDLQANTSRSNGGALNYVFQPLVNIDDPDNTSVPIRANNRGSDKREIDHISLKADHDSEAGTFTGIVSKDRIREYFAGDQFPYSPAISANAPFGPGTDGTQTQFLYTDATQGELRYTSKADQPLRWILGTHYLRSERYISSSNGLDLGYGILPVLRAPQAAGTANPTTLFLADQNTDTASAVFGQVAYDLRDDLELAFALRYDRQKRHQRNASFVAFDPAAGSVREANFSKSQPKLTLTWKPQDSFTLYGSYGEGFRSGGFNQAGTGAAAAQIGLPGVQDRFEAESARSLEFGAKQRLFDGRMQINASVFDTRVNNQLYFVFIGQLGAQVLTNIDRVNLRGYEIDAQYRIAEGLTAFGGYGYTRSEIGAYALESADVGNAAPYVPRYTANAGVEYAPRLSSALDGLLRVDYQRIGQQFWDPGNARSRASLGLTNLRIGVEDHGGRWSATLWAKNLANTRYNAEYVLGGFAQIGQERTLGADFRYNFF
jgi:iron complex outermembrane receptor protein